MMQKDNINPFHIKAHALRSTAYLQGKTEKNCFSTRLTNYLKLVVLYLSYYLLNCVSFPVKDLEVGEI